MLHATAISGPEFLDAVADANEAEGLPINADVFRSRANEWAQDKRTITLLQNELQHAKDRLASAAHALAAL